MRLVFNEQERCKLCWLEKVGVVTQPIILFVNGKVGMPGEPKAIGRPYWFEGLEFFKTAARFFGIDVSNYYSDFPDGERITTGKLREQSGYNFAASNFKRWKKELGNNSINLDIVWFVLMHQEFQGINPKSWGEIKHIFSLI